MKYGLAIITFLALLFPLSSSAKQIKNYESELIVIYGDMLATRNLTKEPNPDFIGWYINKTTKILKISKRDTYRQYLAYYKGWGDYKNYSKDKKAIIYAKSVKDLANNYKKQLTMCQKNLDKNKYIIF